MCFSMLKAALSGNYVNFGVFRLYGDSALDDALGIFVKLLLSITQNDLLVSTARCFETRLFCQFVPLVLKTCRYNLFQTAEMIFRTSIMS